MLYQLSKFVLLVALLSAFAASSASAFRKGEGHGFCAVTTEATNCVLRPDGSCVTQNCVKKSPLNCHETYCVHH